MGARVLPGAHVGKDAFVDGGAVVPAGAKVEAGSLWTGNPAKPLRKLTEDEMAVLRSEAAVQAELSQVHAEQVLISENVEAFEQQDHEYEWKVAHYHDPAQPLPGFTADVQEYMKLSEPAANSGLFRAQEYLDEEAQLDREAADAEESSSACFSASLSMRSISTSESRPVCCSMRISFFTPELPFFSFSSAETLRMLLASRSKETSI